MPRKRNTTWLADSCLESSLYVLQRLQIGISKTYMLHIYFGQHHKNWAFCHNSCICNTSISPTAGEDFTSSAEIVTFNPGASVSITILDDDIREEIETFKV